MVSKWQNWNQILTFSLLIAFCVRSIDTLFVVTMWITLKILKLQ